MNDNYIIKNSYPFNYFKEFNKMSFNVCKSARDTDEALMYWKDVRDLTHQRVGPGTYDLQRVPFLNRKV